LLRLGRPFPDHRVLSVPPVSRRHLTHVLFAVPYQ
jgi:hypothetical protein